MLNFKDYTLFLDRDGVINQRLIDEYVLTPEQFRFIEGVPQALAQAKQIFNTIVVVTNQQGIGKKLMTVKDLEAIHAKMLHEIEQAGGHIDAVYYCPYLAQDYHFLRKPNIGMALLAKKEFPQIHFKQSIMVGDSISDMKFGKRAGMKTVFISQNKHEIHENRHLIDFCFPSLPAFINAI